MEAIILAGGKGTRLTTRLEGVPKPMAPIGNKPFLEILLDRLVAGGCSRAILSVGYLHNVIQQHFGLSYKQMSLEYAIENEPLGTGGAIRKAITAAIEPNILVLNGDTLLDIDYLQFLQFHTGHDSELTIAAVEQENISRYGRLAIEGDRIVSFEEKTQNGGGWINGGVYALKASLIWPSDLPRRFSFESDFLMKDVARLRPLAFKCSGYFLDIGLPEDLDRAQYELAS